MSKANRPVSVTEIMHALYGGCDGVIEFRAFDGNGPAGRLFAELHDSDAIRTFWKEHQPHNTFWGVSTRRDDLDGSLANCLHLPALFVDLDFKLATKAIDKEAAVRERLATCPPTLSPSLVIASGGGLQPYWFLKEPADVQADGASLRDVLRRLAAWLEGDIVVGEPARVLRVPGTYNYKYTPPRSVRIERFEPDRRYNVSDFDWLPAVPLRSVAQPMDFSKVVKELRNVNLYKLARALKGKKVPDIIIASAARTVNAECFEPPLEDWEVRQIVRNALSQPDRPMQPTARLRVEVSE